MSLWTPDGERPVPPAGQTAAPGGAPTPPDAEQAPPSDVQGPPPGATDLSGMPGFDQLSPEEQEQARQMAMEMAEARQRLLSVPAGEVVANHVMGLYELAAIHMSNEPPNLEEGRVALDAMGAVMETCNDRLGENEPALVDALQQLRLAFVQITRDQRENPA